MIAALALLAGLLYGPGLGAPLSLDDYIWVHEATRVASAADLWRVHALYFWRPTMQAWCWLLYALWGVQPVAFHAMGLLLHVVTALLVLHLVARVTGSRVGGAAAALAFMLCGAHAESLCSLSAAGELLVAPCMLGAVLCFVGEGPAAVGLAAATVGQMAKESAVVLPLILLLADRLLPAAHPRSLLRVAPYAIVAALLAIVDWRLVVAAQGPPIRPHSPWQVPLWLAVVRDALNPLVGTAAAGQVPGGLLALLGVAWILVLAVAARRAPVAAFFAAWIPIAAIPYAYLVPDSPLQARYAYLPSIGVAGHGAYPVDPPRGAAAAATHVLRRVVINPFDGTLAKGSVITPSARIVINQSPRTQGLAMHVV